MTADDPLTQRDAESLNQAIRDLSATIKDLRSEMASTYARKDVIEPRLDTMGKDIARHDDWLTWAQRIVIGAVIVALLGLVIASGGGLP